MITDDEIIKALECCLKDELNICNECPYDELCGENPDAILIHSLDLINRRNAEIERLTAKLEKREAELDRLTIYFDEVVDEKLETAKSEAIKEFAERLKTEFEPDPNYEKAVNFTIKLFRNTIDNLVEEMVGD